MIFDCGLSSELSKDLRRYVYSAEKIITAKQQHLVVLDSLSPDLQGRVIYEWYGEWVMRVPYIKDGSPAFVLDVARGLNLQMYNRGEVISQPRTLFTIAKGVVWRRRAALVKGNVWGTDMILDFPILRDDAPALCLTIAELRFQDYKTFSMILEDHPEETHRVRWYCVKLAVQRGVIAYARRVLECERDLGLFPIQA
jgi:hypothetical protein